MYRLLQKLLEICGPEALSRKCAYHNLIYGPRTVAENKEILHCLLKYIDLQINWIGSIINLNVHVEVQKKIHFVFMHVIKFFDFLIWHNDVTSEYTRNGVPVKLNFL